MKHNLTALTKIHQTQNERAFFFQDREVLEDNLRLWRSGEKSLKIAYSLKANYSKKILFFFASKCDYLEVASLDEFELASHYISTRLILVNGPIYSKNDIRVICSSGAIFIIDSLRQLEMINELQQDNLAVFRLGVRVRIKGFPSSRFGVSEQDLGEFKDKLNSKSKIELLHCHYCDGFRSVYSFKERLKALEKIRQRCFTEVNHLNIGGGFYSEMPKVLSKQFDEVIPSILDYVRCIDENYPLGVNVTTEIGAALVANAVDYVCRVEDVKEEGPQVFIVTNGSKWDIKPNGSEKNLPIEVYSKEVKKRAMRQLMIVGYTCMENDILFNGEVEMPTVGDFLVFNNCGAYGQSLAPDFIVNRKNTV